VLPLPVVEPLVELVSPVVELSPAFWPPQATSIQEINNETAFNRSIRFMAVGYGAEGAPSTSSAASLARMSGTSAASS
jgi:hypothetical protein